MMPGMIMLWYGSVASIPSGWHLCDGTVGTPDLRGRFVYGVRSDLLPPRPGDVGGSVNHNHDFTGDGHLHFIDTGEDIQAGIGYEEYVTTEPAVGTTDIRDGRPPYHALCYIMKL